ncbi:MAG TPA: hypothetical protein VLE47_03905 [Candidatus Saccharimonadales bacterium]|nr:hypothetical protein [Candidatus Saccharimonadales bacterium]
MDFKDSKEHEALKFLLDSQFRTDKLSRFLIQQNIIQFYLAVLIATRSGLPDRDLIDWVENMTLGNLLKIFKVTISINKKELNLLKDLKDYNRKRNFLVHKLFAELKYKKVEEEAEEALKTGSKILGPLVDLVKIGLKSRGYGNS